MDSPRERKAFGERAAALRKALGPDCPEIEYYGTGDGRKARLRYARKGLTYNCGAYEEVMRVGNALFNVHMDSVGCCIATAARCVLDGMPERIGGFIGTREEEA